MAQHKQSRRRPTRPQVAWIGIGVVSVLFAAIVIFGGYYFQWKWTGYPKRTPWDWVDLLIVPIVLAVGGYLFTHSENLRAQRIAKRRAKTDREIAAQRAQETALQAYLEQLTQLVGAGLRDKDRCSPIRLLARGRTLHVFWQLDPKRKRALLQMLHEAGLIGKEAPVIGLSGADLREAYLQELDLKDANLTGADMKGANLDSADLTGADLRGADLSHATLIRARLGTAKISEGQFDNCKSLEGATMPDGQILKSSDNPDGPTFEDWLKAQKGRGEDGENSGPS
jgi:hypothetical protein